MGGAAGKPVGEELAQLSRKGQESASNERSSWRSGREGRPPVPELKREADKKRQRPEELRATFARAVGGTQEYIASTTSWAPPYTGTVGDDFQPAVVQAIDGQLGGCWKSPVLGSAEPGR